MINIGFGPNILLGLILGFGVILLYFLRIVPTKQCRPIGIERDDVPQLLTAYDLCYY